MKPYWQHNGITIYHGDCRDVLPTLEPVDLVLMDPPYGVEYRTNFGRSGDYGAASWRGTSIKSDESTALRDYVLDWHEGPAFVFGTWKVPPHPSIKACMIWDKGPASGMGDLSFPWKGSFELIHARGKGFIGSRDEGVLRGHIVVSWESAGRRHPTQKPVSLCTTLLMKCPAEWIILDPVLGSGSMLVAAKKLGRRAIGIEIEERYCEIAARRIMATPEPLPFPKAEPQPVQSNLF